MDFTAHEVLYEDMSLLGDIYDLNKLNFEMVKEDLRVQHAYKMIGDPQILIEGFSDMLGKMGDFFKNMSKKIAEFFKKLFMHINAHFMEIDKFVKKYKKELDSIKNVNFTIYGYNFTIKDKPDISPFVELVNGYNSSISDVKGIDTKAIGGEESEMLSDKNLNKIRGIVLGTNKDISEDDFTETARKYYRGGENETVEITIDDSKFREALNSVDTLMKNKRDAEKYRDQLIYALHRAEIFFEKKATALYVDNKKKASTSKLKFDEDDNSLKTDEDVFVDYNDSSINAMNRLIRYKYNYTKALSSIINIATNEYCNAYKDNVKMVREIITGALKKENIEDKSSAKSDD